jgi:precorrin-2 dehydrogenase/sirohydrochlorin ferrochelatase
MSPKRESTYLPLFFNLTDRPCLVVGGGKVAQRKVEQLLKAGAEVTIISPHIEPGLRRRLQPQRCEWLQRNYISPEASAYHLVIATTDDPGVNRQIYKDCLVRGVPLNVVDQPNLCTVIFPSIIRRGLVTLAISSGGKTPFLTHALRKQLETFLANVELLERSELLVTFRDFVKSRTDNFDVKKRLYQRLLACDKAQWSGGPAAL